MGDFVQGGHGQIDISPIDDRSQVPEEESQKQGADMGAIDVGVGHDDDAVIAELIGVDGLPYPNAQGDDEVLQFFELDDLVQAGSFSVENFSAEARAKLCVSGTSRS